MRQAQRTTFLKPDPALAIEHYSYSSVEHYITKFNRYTSIEAKAPAQAKACPE